MIADGYKFITLDADYINNFDEVVVIGDIHGCSEEFEELLDKIHETTPSRNPDKVLKIIVGDLVNKGPNSKRVVEVCADKYSKSILSVRGNHEEIVLSLAQKLKEEPLLEKNKWIEKFPSRYVDYLRKLPYSIKIPPLNCIVVHGGVDPSKDDPATETPITTITTMRDIVVQKKPNSDDTYYECTKENRGAAWATFWPGPEHVYFGHDAKRRLQDDHEFATGLDTGCVYGGSLTCKYIKGVKEGSMLEVKAKKVYEPIKE